jgi:hypothetical protein
VKILKGMKEFVGKTGRIIDEEKMKHSPKRSRVRLDKPVDVPGVGLVTDDLWERLYFKLLREV